MCQKSLIFQKSIKHLQTLINKARTAFFFMLPAFFMPVFESENRSETQKLALLRKNPVIAITENFYCNNGNFSLQ